MEFDTVYITKKELQWLRKLAKANRSLPSSPHETGLMEYKLITRQLFRNEDGSSAGLHSAINDKGKKYLIYRAQCRRRDRKDSARFILSTVLAILALIISIIALAIDLLQLS